MKPDIHWAGAALSMPLIEYLVFSIGAWEVPFKHRAVPMEAGMHFAESLRVWVPPKHGYYVPQSVRSVGRFVPSPEGRGRFIESDISEEADFRRNVRIALAHDRGKIPLRHKSSVLESARRSQCEVHGSLNIMQIASRSNRSVAEVLEAFRDDKSDVDNLIAVLPSGGRIYVDLEEEGDTGGITVRAPWF